MEVFVVLSAALALAAAVPGVTSVDNLSLFRRLFDKCLASNDTVTCLSIKGITALNRAARSAKIEILPGVLIRRDSTSLARSNNTISENEITNSLPTEESERSGRLFDLAMDSLADFIDSHSLELKFPKGSSQAFARAIEEGKKKTKHHLGPLAMALAIKALFLAKLALLSHFCKCHKSGGHKSGGYTEFERLVANGANGAQSADFNSGTGFGGTGFGQPYSRAYDRAEDSAYSAYADRQAADKSTWAVKRMKRPTGQIKTQSRQKDWTGPINILSQAGQLIREVVLKSSELIGDVIMSVFNIGKK